MLSIFFFYIFVSRSFPLPSAFPSTDIERGKVFVLTLSIYATSLAHRYSSSFCKVVPSLGILSRISDSVLEDIYSPRKCCYDPIQIEDSLIEVVFRELPQDGKDYFCDTISKAAIMSRIANISPYYKHKAYISESEWRFVLSSLGEISFNKYGNKIKPYRTFPIPLSALTSIMIGPCIKDSNTIIGIEYMIKSKLGNDFEIKYSAIPYRG